MSETITNDNYNSYNNVLLSQNNQSNNRKTFILEKNNKNYLFSLFKKNNRNNEEFITIVCQEQSDAMSQYEINISFEEYQKLNDNFRNFNNINDAYKHLLQVFNYGKMTINSLETNMMTISFFVYDMMGNNEGIYLKLNQKENDKKIDILFNEIQKLKNEISLLKSENSSLKNNFVNEINTLKNENKDLKEKYESLNKSVSTLQNSLNIQQNYKSNTIPYKIDKTDNILINQINQISLIKIKNLIDLSNSNNDNNNEIIFTIVKTYNNEIYLVYVNNKTSIIIHDIKNDEEKNIMNAHSNYISFLSHFTDIRFNKKKDIIVSLSYLDNKCKFWNIDNLESYLTINIKFRGELSSICLFAKKNDLFLFASSQFENEPIKFYNVYNNEKIIKDSEAITNKINIIYDKVTEKNYLITCNKNIILSFNLENYELYKCFIGEGINHLSAIIYYDGKISKLLDAEETGRINVYNFNLGQLMKQFLIGNNPIKEILLLDDKKYIICCDSNYLNFMNIRDKKLIVIHKEEYKKGYSIQRFNTQKEDCLVIQDKSNEKIDLWRIG